MKSKIINCILLVIFMITLVSVPNSARALYLPSVLAEPSKDVIEENNAILCGRVGNLNKEKMTEVGITIMDSSKNIIKEYKRAVDTNEHELLVYFDINKDLGLTLVPGTTYKYNFSAIFSGEPSLIVLDYSFTTLKASKENNNGKVSISNKKVTMYPNMTKNIKINNVSSKVKWKSSNKKIAKVLGTSGVNGNVATIMSGKKVGTCTIKATVKGKTYKCKVTVKKDGKISRVTLKKVIQTKKKISVTVKVINKSNKEMIYGESFSVEKYTNGKWKKVEYKKDTAFIAIAYVLLPKSSNEKTYSLDTVHNMSDFSKGTYRIRVEAFGKKAFNYAIFNLK